jgi:hypothetical protein
MAGVKRIVNKPERPLDFLRSIEVPIPRFLEHLISPVSNAVLGCPQNPGNSSLNILRIYTDGEIDG